MARRFEDVEFRRDYPAPSVADNEIFMSFSNDDDAIAFYDWWFHYGSKIFQKHLDDIQ